MLKQIALAVVAAVLSYVVGAVLGGWLLYQYSSNQHDRELEALMAGAFFFGPAACILGCAVSFVVLRRSRQRRQRNRARVR